MWALDQSITPEHVRKGRIVDPSADLANHRFRSRTWPVVTPSGVSGVCSHLRTHCRETPAHRGHCLVPFASGQGHPWCSEYLIMNVLSRSHSGESEIDFPFCPAPQSQQSRNGQCHVISTCATSLGDPGE